MKIQPIPTTNLQYIGQISPDNLQPDFKSKYSSTHEINISLNGMIKLLQGLKPDKTPGPDHIRPLLLQKLCLEIAPVLQILFTRSLIEGTMPSDWRRENVLPIFKKGEKTSPTNYRLISLTYILYKLLEHYSYIYYSESREENPQKLTQLSSRCHPRHLVGKKTAQKDTIIDITSESQVNSNFPYRWSPASLSFCNYFYLFLYLYIT